MRTGLFAAALLVLAGCASQSQPTLDPGAAKSFDGLTAVSGTNASEVWVRPDFDLSGYNKLLVRSAGIQYRPVERNVGGSQANLQFPMSATQKDGLQEIVGEEFRSALGRLERYEIVDQPGPDVLLLRIGLMDVVSRVPSTPAGRADLYIDSPGEASLLIELADSESEATLLRVVDRQAAGRGRSYRVTAVSSANDVRRMAKNWAADLVDSLEEVSDLHSIAER